MEEEEWRSIPDHPGFELSNRQRVRVFTTREGIPSSEPRIVKPCAAGRRGPGLIAFYVKGKVKRRSIQSLTEEIFGDIAQFPCLEGEEWREAPKYPGIEASNFGRVRSWWRVAGKGQGKGCGSIRILADQPKILKPCIDRQGYHQIVLRAPNGKRGNVYVHHLVLTAFVGPRPEGMEACHSPDPTRTNNRLDNLRWDTRSGNMVDVVLTGTRRGVRLPIEDIPIIWERLQAGESPVAIAKEYKVHISAIRFIKQERSWTHITRNLPGFGERYDPCRDERSAIYPHRRYLETDEEIWLAVQGYPGYEVSSWGQIGSYHYNRWGFRPDLGRKILKMSHHPHGYPFVLLRDESGQRSKCYVHRLVLNAFAGPCPEGMEACHAPDPDPTNNHVRNLRWDNHSRNLTECFAARQ